MSSTADWAASGAMALSGRADGPPLLAPGDPAGYVRHRLAEIGEEIPGLLGERAAYAGLARCGPWSCGGAFRMLPARDGWVGLSLPRPSDVELVPALVEGSVCEDPWPAVASWLAAVGVVEAEERLHLLGLAGGAVRESTARREERPGVVVDVLGSRTRTERPLVVDLTSLWAGPLCAHLLGRRGAHVVKVESRTRPDGARRGSPDFFALLHDGHEQVELNLRADRSLLLDLMARADLVLEASRPRALRQLGIVAEEVVAGGTSWLSITARGRASDTIGFGDDVAACAGLVRDDGDGLVPVGDALADPLAGVTAAAAAVDALASAEARLIDVSMLHVAADVGGAIEPHTLQRRDDTWWVEAADGAHVIEEPRRR